MRGFLKGMDISGIREEEELMEKDAVIQAQIKEAKIAFQNGKRLHDFRQSSGPLNTISTLLSKDLINSLADKHLKDTRIALDAFNQSVIQLAESAGRLFEVPDNHIEVSPDSPYSLAARHKPSKRPEETNDIIRRNRPAFQQQRSRPD